ncbi:MAG: hypothetical protein RR380_08190 [Gordonibacter sp.]
MREGSSSASESAAAFVTSEALVSEREAEGAPADKTALPDEEEAGKASGSTPSAGSDTDVQPEAEGKASAVPDTCEQAGGQEGLASPEAEAPLSSAPRALSAIYVSASGSDAAGTGTSASPYATLGAAVSAADSLTQVTIMVVGDIVCTTTATVGAKNIVVYGVPGTGGAAPTVRGGTATVSLFTVSTGSLTFKNIAFNGASVAANRRVVEVTGAGGRLTLDAGATISRWYTTGSTGAIRIAAPNAVFTMKNGSSISSCLLVTQGNGVGGGAASVTAGRVTNTTTTPLSAGRASLVMESGASIYDCDTRMNVSGELSGGGAFRAVDALVDIQAGATVRYSDVTFVTIGGASFDPTSFRQGGGALFASNCKLAFAGTIDSCNFVGQENTGVENFRAGGGAMYLHSYGCTALVGVDCRAEVAGSIINCTAFAGGGVYYWSEANVLDGGAFFWTGQDGPRTSADQVIASNYDALILRGSIRSCRTFDTASTRRITLNAGSTTDFSSTGIGGGAVCGANGGLVALADQAVIDACTTGTEGGAISSCKTSIFALSNTLGSGGPTITNCSSKSIGGGLSLEASAHLERISLTNCSAAFGGGMYMCGQSATMYDCVITGCSAKQYGGGILQNSNHDLFMYGGTIRGNTADVGGGGIAVCGNANGTAAAPRGLVFNYPATANGGYTNPAFCKTTILAGKIGVPCIVLDNTQGSAKQASNLWTYTTNPALRIFMSGNFVAGSKMGVNVGNGAVDFNKVPSQFATAGQASFNLNAFKCDLNSTYAAAYSTKNALNWVFGYAVDYQANVPMGSTLQGQAPFDGEVGISNLYYQSGGLAPILDQGTMVVDGYLFKGWSTSASAKTPTYLPGSTLSYSTQLDPDKDSRIPLYAVWEKIVGACQIIRDTNNDGVPDAFFKEYKSIYNAFLEVATGDRVEMLKDSPLVDFSGASGSVPSDGRVVLVAEDTKVVFTTAPAMQPIAGAQAWAGPPSQSGTPRATITRTSNSSTASALVIMGGITLGTLSFEGACTPAQAASGLGLQATRPLFEVSGASSALTLGEGARIANACTVGATGGAIRAGTGSTVVVSGGSISACTAQDGGALAVSSDDSASPATLRVDGGSVSGCFARRWGAGIFVGKNASATLAGSAEVRGNTASLSGGGVYVDTLGLLAMKGGMIADNACTAQDSSGSAAHVGGVGSAAFRGGAARITVSGNASVCGNKGRAAGESSAATARASDLEVARANTSYLVALGAEGLGSSARIGITATDQALLASGAQYAVVSSGLASDAPNLSLIFNNNDASLIACAGLGQAVVWRPLRVSVSFAKVGAIQETGLYKPLAGAAFSLYRYVGSTVLNAGSINSAAVEAASITSTQWAPVVAADGTEGLPGVSTNVPYAFTSADGTGAASAGTVTLQGIDTSAWYMLVETAAPLGYSKPRGQWAFRTVETAPGTGVYRIDTQAMLARIGSDGSQPPAFRTSLTMPSGIQQGLFLPNVPVFNLPFVGTSLWFPVISVVGMVLAAVGVRMLRKKSSRK